MTKAEIENTIDRYSDLRLKVWKILKELIIFDPKIIDPTYEEDADSLIPAVNNVEMLYWDSTFTVEWNYGYEEMYFASYSIPFKALENDDEIRKFIDSEKQKASKSAESKKKDAIRQKIAELDKEKAKLMEELNQ